MSSSAIPHYWRKTCLDFLRLHRRSEPTASGAAMELKSMKVTK